MSYNATVFKVMIASPGDVRDERKLIREVLHDWNDIHSETRKIVLLPVAWETHSSPEMGDRPQAIINRQLKDCDLLVGVFGTRIGTATGDYSSGTVEEIEEHIKMKKPAMLYFSRDALVSPCSFDPVQYSKLKEFEEACKSKGLCETYSDIDELKDKFKRQLQLKLNEDMHFTGISQPLKDTEFADKIKYIQMIRSEIMLCIAVLEQDTVQPLPVDRWTSVVNSGALKLFEEKVELESLSKNYYKIQRYNVHVGTYANISWNRLYREKGWSMPLFQVKQFLKSREDLQDELKKLMDEDWLNPNLDRQ
ncbi:MAG TPA: DUF4062 domain-containing protein [Methanothrix sp.]|nr:DUF4062 domain-containing protein [Methanothrix sp.]HRW81917.1 DUF4062 domain-containing protein [Methanothrix sp.]